MDLPFHILDRIAHYSTTKTLVNIHKTCTVMCDLTQEQVIEKKKKCVKNKFIKQTTILLERFQENSNSVHRKKKALYAIFEHQLDNFHVWKTWERYCIVLKGKVDEILTSNLQIPEIRLKRIQKLHCLLT